LRIGVGADTALRRASHKAPADRTQLEQSLVNAMTGRMREKHSQAASVATSEYRKWASDPCHYSAPDGSYDAAQACIGMSQLFAPQSPGLQAFTNYGAVAAYQSASDPNFQAVLAGTASSELLLYGYAAALAAGGVGGAVGASLPTASFLAIFPYAARAAATALRITAAAAEVLPAGAIGAATVGGIAAIVIATVATAVLAGIEVFDEAAIPGSLNTMLANAASYDVGAALNSSDASTSANATSELYATFIAMTMPDFPSSGPVPAAQPTDPRLSVQGSPVAAIQYLAGDKSHHSARLSGGWWVDTDASNLSRLTTSIEFLGPDGQITEAGRTGSTFAIMKVASTGSDIPVAGTNGAALTLQDWSGKTTTATYGAPGAAMPAATPSPNVALATPYATASVRPDLDGARIHADGNNDIYLVDSVGARHHIPDPTTFSNLFRDWSGVQVVDLTQVASGAELTSGAYLATPQAGNGNIYLVTNGPQDHQVQPPPG
jgi:hypothetical protein